MNNQSYDDAKIREMYERVVEQPNENIPKKGYIKCPVCGEEILMIPTLRIMGEAIENHVQKHKEILQIDPIKSQQTAILVRLSLMGQVLQQACNLEIK